MNWPSFRNRKISPPGPGFHLAFDAASRQSVTASTRPPSSTGKDIGSPGLRPHYGQTYYAAFVADPDGYKLEAVCQ